MVDRFWTGFEQDFSNLVVKCKVRKSPNFPASIQAMCFRPNDLKLKQQSANPSRSIYLSQSPSHHGRPLAWAILSSRHGKHHAYGKCRFKNLTNPSLGWSACGISRTKWMLGFLKLGFKILNLGKLLMDSTLELRLEKVLTKYFKMSGKGFGIDHVTVLLWGP